MNNILNFKKSISFLAILINSLAYSQNFTSNTWLTRGNEFTIPGTGPGQTFLGTKDLKDLVFGVNSDEKLRITQTGRLKFYNQDQAGLKYTNLYIGGGNENLSSWSGNYYNVAIGLGSMLANRTGSINTALGYNSLSSNEDGSVNTAVGYQSLGSNTKGSVNTAVGYQTLVSNLTGSGNTAVGTSSLTLSKEDFNTAIGYNSLSSISIGSRNTATGSDSLNSVSEGNNNSAYGSGSLQTLRAGYSNTSMGTGSMPRLETGNNNVAIGTSALSGTTSGDNNIAIGVGAGRNLKFGRGNIFIGSSFSTQANNPNGNNQLNIGGWIQGDDGNIAIGALPELGTRLRTNGALKFEGLSASSENTVLTINPAGLVTTRNLNTIVNTVTGNATVSATLTGNNYQLNSPNQTMSIAGNTLSLTNNGGATTSIPLPINNTTVAAGTNISITGTASNPIINGATYTGTGIATVTQVAGQNAFTINVPPTAGLNNIYNINGSLVDDRTVDLNQKKLFFLNINDNSGLSNGFLLSPDGNTVDNLNRGTAINTTLSTANLAPNLYGGGFNTNQMTQSNGDFSDNTLKTDGIFNKKAWVQVSASCYNNSGTYIGNHYYRSLGCKIAAPYVINPLGGNVGVGVESPTAQLHTINSVRFENLANGTSPSYVLGTDAAGNVNNYNLSQFGGASTQNAWLLNGNDNTIPGTDPGQNFIGTKDLKDLVFGVGNEEKLRITKTGRLKFYNVDGSNPINNNNIYIGGGNDNLSLRINNYANVAVGLGAMSANTEGSANTATGHNSLGSNKIGYLNCAYGIGSLQTNSEGHNNVSMGGNSMMQNISGSSNTAIGSHSLFTNQVGNNNTAIGSDSIQNLNNGSNNVALGSDAGYNLTSGNNNIFIGTATTANNPTRDNQLNIGGWIQGYNGSIAIGALPELGTRLRTNGALKFEGLSASSENTVLTINPAGLVTTRNLNTIVNTVTGNATVSATLTGNNYQLNSPNQTMSIAGNTLSLTNNGGATTSIPLPINNTTVAAGTNIRLTGTASNPIINGATYTGTGIATVTQVAGQNAFTINVPAPAASINIYNTSSSLTANRVVAMNSKTLNFNFDNNITTPALNTLAINSLNNTANFNVANNRLQSPNLDALGHTTIQQNGAAITDPKSNLTTGYATNTTNALGLSKTNLYFWTQASNKVANTNATPIDYMINPLGGKVAIGTFNVNSASCTDCNNYRLFVAQGIRTEKVRVDIANVKGWADYVFDKDYSLMPLNQLENYIDANGHLPNIPKANQVVKEGIDLGVMNSKLLEKVEELTLHAIELNKKNELQQKQIDNLVQRLEKIEQTTKQ